MISLFSSVKKNLLRYQNLVKQVPDLFDQGLSETCRLQMKEVIDFCDRRVKERNKDKKYWWVYGMGCCLYERAFLHFGKKSGRKYLNLAKTIGEKNNFYDVLFWIDETKLEWLSITGRTKNIQEIFDSCYGLLEKMENPLKYKILLMILEVRVNQDKGEYDLAKKCVVKLLESVKELKEDNLPSFANAPHSRMGMKRRWYASEGSAPLKSVKVPLTPVGRASQIKGNILMGEIFAASGKREDAISYFQKAISMGGTNKTEELIPALYNLGLLFLSQEKIHNAKRNLEEFQKRFSELELSNSLYHMQLLRFQGILSQKEKKYEKAEECFNQSIKIAEEEENPLEKGRTHVCSGKLYLELKNYEKAKIAFENASAKFIIIDNRFQLEKVKQAQNELKQKSLSTKKQETPQIAEPPKNEISDEFMKSIISSLDLNTALTNIINYIMKITEADRGFLILLDKEGKLRSEVIEMKEKSKGEKIQFKNFSQTFTGEVLKTGKSILITDAQSDSRFASAMSVMALEIRTVICVPLKEKGKIMGLVYIDRMAANAFADSDLNIVESMAKYASLAIINAQMHSQVQEKLATTEDQLTQTEKLATMGIFAGGVAHEINNPLGAILTNVQMLLAETKAQDQKESLEIIEKGVRRCRIIVQNLLTYSRPSSPEEMSNIIDLNQVINNTLSLLQHQLENEKLQIEKEYTKIDDIQGSSNQLEQVFVNLILNARDATKKMDRKGKIIIKTYQKENFVFAEINDNGCGISKETINKSFDPFFTTKKVGKGTGLGLFVCYGIITKHNGTINASSKIGEGSTFTVKLPIKR